MINKFLKNTYRELLALGVLLIAFFPTLLWMWDRWFSASSYYSHGVLIPFVTGYLIWQSKDELKKIKRVESPWGMRFIIFGAVVHFFSSMFRVNFSSGFAMLIVLFGLVLFFYGSKIFQKIAFPMAFLIFMIPVPEVVIVNLSFKLKMFAAEVATVILNHMRIPAIRDGSLIRMRSTTVVVDDVCSGLRSLISLTALGSIMAYWLNANVFKKVLLFLSTIPIAIVTNVVRVIILASVSEIYGAQYASGFLHDATGYMVFGLAFILLYMVGKILE